MYLEVISRHQADQKTFVDFWASKYVYPQENLYADNIGQPLTADSVRSLYHWKNGTSKLSTRKTRSVETIYIAALDDAPKLTSIAEGQAYIGRLDGGAIWDIFWLHCLARHLFPIFDQHTYRAMVMIDSGNPEEIPRGRARKLDSYFTKYIPFLDRFKGFPRENLDRALFTYGRFLKSAFSQ